MFTITTVTISQSLKETMDVLRHTNESITIAEAAETVVMTVTAANKVQYARVARRKKKAV